MTAGKTTAQVFGLFGLLATAISLGFTAADVAAQEVAPKVMTAEEAAYRASRTSPLKTPTADIQAKIDLRRFGPTTDSCTATKTLAWPLPLARKGGVAFR